MACECAGRTFRQSLSSQIFTLKKRIIYTVLVHVWGSTSSALSHSSANFHSGNLLWIPSREENMILFSPRREISRRLLLPEISFLTERRHVAVVDEQQCTSFEDLTNYMCSNFSAATPPSSKLREWKENSDFEAISWSVSAFWNFSQYPPQSESIASFSLAMQFTDALILGPPTLPIISSASACMSCWIPRLDIQSL